MLSSSLSNTYKAQRTVSTCIRIGEYEDLEENQEYSWGKLKKKGKVARWTITKLPIYVRKNWDGLTKIYIVNSVPNSEWVNNLI